MAIVTGRLGTFFKRDLSGRAPFIRFIPSGVGFKSGYIFAEAHKDVYPIDDGTGDFSVDLEVTDQLENDCWFKVEIWYLPDPNLPPGQTPHYACVDFPELQLRVPSGGGDLVDLAAMGNNPLFFWANETGDIPAPARSGDWLWNTTTDDVFRLQRG
ncbi:hypothetical protein ASC66_01290 [Leifsonia sp. Root4]|uniref:hypothetical protein n=1 Tax=Leifsonia sp. Root4 TaxID=1736525 RepID=UPI0006F79135|nr:hypothetical protein [Leifsonia sp. Root4]KQW07663.1 hypothetical protein ASC66_01290 [Leifsonia sp. Root4]